MITRENAAATPSLGELDEFRLLRALGHGGMGAVFLGHDTVLDRLVAIKVIRARSADEISRLRFLTEARAVARLNHPNVVTIFRAATTRDGQPYIAQEWVSGTSLDRMALPVEPRRAAEIGLGIARGLAAAHRRGILHRDVKPANVVVDDAGTPKLLDFGLAKLTGIDRETGDLSLDRTAPDIGRDAGAASPSPALVSTMDVGRRRARAAASEHAAIGVGAMSRSWAASPDETAPLPGAPLPAPVFAAAAPSPSNTATGAVLGTPRYLAPEIWLHQPATPRSDLFSFGALLYELVAGAPPYTQETREALQEAVLRGDQPLPLTDRVPSVDAALAELVAECLARDPAARPDSADHVVHRLERILGGVSSLPDGNPYPGLAPFDAEHRAVFHGRGADISAAVDRLRQDPLVVVAGDSGVGKSSLCRAGVIPAILSGALGDGRTWRARPIVLGRDPVAALREGLGLEALAQDADPTELCAALAIDPGHGLLVFVDQLEELSTLADPADAALAAGLLAALAGDLPGVKVLLAVRGDYLTRVASLPELGPRVPPALHLLRALGPADAREAVLAPARAKGVRFESDEMVAELAAALDGDPGALPLVQFALAELWQRRDAARAVIPRAALEQVGGVTGALARHADRVLTHLGPDGRAAARRLLLSLVTAEGTRASRERAELTPTGDQAASEALEALVAGRLVIARDDAGGAPLYTLAHESLVGAWTTLRGWLDDAAGQRGLRVRLHAAVDEWNRQGRPRDLLWERARLNEAARLDELTLGDRDFLAASRRGVRRRSIGRALLIAALPIAVVATGLALRMRDQASRDDQVAEHLVASAGELETAERARRDGQAHRDQAMELFDSETTAEVGPSPALNDRRDAKAEAAWKQAVGARLGARGAFRRAADQLEAALLVDMDRRDVRARMAEVLYQQALLAEEQGDRATIDETLRRLANFDDGALLARWNQPASLTVEAPGARTIAVQAYVDRGGRLELAAPASSAGGARLTASMPAGSYRIELTGVDGLVVHAPVLLARGEGLQLRLPLPRAEQIPDGFVYVPPGRFLTGASGHEIFRREFLYATPLHQVETGAYLIARHEVTFAQWMEYLRALSPAERDERRPRSGGGYGPYAVRLEGDGPFELVIERDGKVTRTGQEGHLQYPDRATRREVRWVRTPVSGVTVTDARAYAAWMSTSGRLPGARLCTQLEWERAARGADGRLYPPGDMIEPDDANIDVTYGRLAQSFGADEVGAHPRSDSPFGVADLFGNVWELVETGIPSVVKMRGGTYYHGAASGQSANREFAEAALRSPWTGLRLCADPPDVP